MQASKATSDESYAPIIYSPSYTIAISTTVSNGFSRFVYTISMIAVTTAGRGHLHCRPPMVSSSHALPPSAAESNGAMRYISYIHGHG
jgi:hypothetical protein